MGILALTLATLLRLGVQRLHGPGAGRRLAGEDPESL